LKDPKTAIDDFKAAQGIITDMAAASRGRRIASLISGGCHQPQAQADRRSVA
jgi:hypothetical protein